MLTVTATAEQRFDAKYVVDPATGCWLWQGAKTEGYGQISIAGKIVYAHIWAWVQRHGPVPSGLQLDHFICDNRGCVNPAHVRPVTARENRLRGKGKAWAERCSRGHAYDAVDRNGYSVCTICVRESKRRYDRTRRSRP